MGKTIDVSAESVDELMKLLEKLRVEAIGCGLRGYHNTADHYRGQVKGIALALKTLGIECQ